MIEQIFLNSGSVDWQPSLLLSLQYKDFVKDVCVKALLVGESLASETFQDYLPFKKCFWPKTSVYSSYLQGGVSIITVSSGAACFIRKDVIIIYSSDQPKKDPAQLRLFE